MVTPVINICAVIKNAFRCGCQLAIFSVLFFCITGSLQAQSSSTINIQSETRLIYLGDVVVLDIESTGLLDPLDVSQLRQSPDFLRETTGTRIAVIEGKVVEIAIRRMEFIPEKEGTLVYGPLTGETIFGDIVSNSISVQVKPALNAQWQPGADDVLAEISFSNNQPIVGEQIIVDLRLRHKYQIANEQFVLPAFPEFDVLPVFEQRRTFESSNTNHETGSANNPDESEKNTWSLGVNQTTNNNEQWRQVAWRFLLHAKKSGSINVQPMTWSGTMIKSRSQRGEFNKTIKATTLQVLPTPADRPAWWLPATSVNVSDTWSKDVRSLSAGDEIIRTITLQANNILSNQIPDIEPYPTRALTSTLIRSTRNHKLNVDHTTATGVFEFRMVAQSPIPVFLDTVRVPWWNTITGTHEEAIIPARRINVGLPDRADLLADLAVNNSHVARWLFTLRSYARWQPLLIALGSLIIMAALYPLVRDGVKFDISMRKQHKSLKKLKGLQNERNWQSMYRELVQLERTNTIDSTCQHYQRLLRLLQAALFGKNEAAIQQLSTTKIKLRFKHELGTPRQNLIAEL